jgi:hypothetical protein
MNNPATGFRCAWNFKDTDGGMDGAVPDGSDQDGSVADGGSGDGGTVTDGGVKAVLLINEINPNLTGGDLVELKVVSGGTLNGIVLYELFAAQQALITFPDLAVQAGEVVVVHVGMLTPPANETNATGKGGCTETFCYPDAWDLFGRTSGVSFSNRVIWIKNADATVEDAVPFLKSNLTGAYPSAFPADLALIQAAGYWLPADCSGIPCTCTNVSDCTATTVAVDWKDCGNTAAGLSVQRKTTADTNTKHDWYTGTGTFGLPNTFDGGI